MRLLELFAGTASVSQAFRAQGWECITLDLDPKTSPTICTNILDWTCPYPPGYFDVVWAGCDCRHYSLARTTAKTPRDLLLADSLVLRTLSLIWYLQPKAWFIENPQTGLLRTRPFMHNLPYKDITYCSYGYPYAKKTRIWTNFPSWTPRPLCNKATCPFVQNNRHLATAQLGPGKNHQGQRLTNDAFVREQLYSMPPALCTEIAESVSTFLGD